LWGNYVFISFTEKKRTKESCPAICFSLSIYYSMGRNLFRHFPLNNKYSGASWNGTKNPYNPAEIKSYSSASFPLIRDEPKKSAPEGGASIEDVADQRLI